MIAELLPKGKENAVAAKDLAKITGRSYRNVTSIVERERRAGAPICSVSHGERTGYYLAADKDEMKDFTHRLWHRAGEIHKTRRALIATIENLPDKGGIETR